MNVSFFESHLCAFVVVSYFCMLFIQIIKIFFCFCVNEQHSSAAAIWYVLLVFISCKINYKTLENLVLIDIILIRNINERQKQI